MINIDDIIVMPPGRCIYCQAQFRSDNHLQQHIGDCRAHYERQGRRVRAMRERRDPGPTRVSLADIRSRIKKIKK